MIFSENRFPLFRIMLGLSLFYHDAISIVAAKSWLYRMLP
jgi:hypothetical protein